MWPAALLGAVLLGPAGGADKVSDRDLAGWVDRHVKKWQPSAEEKRFDEIGWCHSVRQAERLAKKHKRPVFWFSHDGRMGAGRC
jgi:hypothetical protein